jgi:GT2 family glycosyltransferase
MWINCEAIDWIYLTMVKNNHTGMVFNINWEYPNTLTRNLLKSKVGQYILSTGYNTMWGRMHERGKAPSSGLYRFYTIASCSLVLEKELFFRIGKYNESIIFQGEDTDLTYRLNSLSIEIFSVFDVTLFHNHQDRLNIDGFLARLSNGYTSEFKAVKNGLIISSNFKSYKGSKKIIFEFFRITEKIWIFINWAIPNISIMKSFNNRLIGILAGLQRYKAWCKYY